MIEPPRVSLRLNFLNGWSQEQVREVSAGCPRARSPAVFAYSMQYEPRWTAMCPITSGLAAQPIDCEKGYDRLS